MSGLGDTIYDDAGSWFPVGTRFRVGGNVNVGDIPIGQIAECFAEASSFHNLKISRAGNVQPYVWIEGELATPMSRAQIQSAFRFYLSYCSLGGSSGVVVRSVDPVQISDVPGYGPVDNFPEPNNSSPKDWLCGNFPVLCGDGINIDLDNDEGVLDTLAKWLGVSPTTAAIVGAGAMLVLIVALKRAV